MSALGPQSGAKRTLLRPPDFMSTCPNSLMSPALFFQQRRQRVFGIPVLKRLRLGELTAEDEFRDQVRWRD
jgi:hypothetical protein